MTQDDQNEKGRGIVPTSGGLRPFIVYRNPKGAPIRTAWDQVEKERLAKGMPVFRCGREPLNPKPPRS